MLTELRESNELAAILSSFIDPVDGTTNRLLQIKPAGLGVDGGGLVLLENLNHFEVIEVVDEDCL